MSAVSPARQCAFMVLLRVARDGAYAERVLDALLKRRDLEPRDRALATEIIYGTLRRGAYLDFLLGQLARQPLHKLPLEVLVALRMGAYQIVDTRVAAHSAVHEAVELVRGAWGRLAGLVNAMLRRLSLLQAQGELPDPGAVCGDALAALAIAGAVPEWLVRRLAAVRGEAEARAWVEATNVVPPLALRVNRHRTDRGTLAQILLAAGLSAELPAAFPDALLLRHAGAVARLPGFAEGLFSVQDPAASLVGYLAGAAEGSSVLDACAAPGGKAVHLAEMVGSTGLVVACDIHAARTRLIADNAARMKLSQLKVAVADATSPKELRALARAHKCSQVDVAVVDAPCSGMGTLRRNPEGRSAPESRLCDLVKTQDALLRSVAELVKPGGTLVYAVCTPTQEEGPDRVDQFLQEHPNFEPILPDDTLTAPFVEQCHGRLTGRHFSAVRTWTHLHGIDSFFAVRLVRSR